MEELKNTTGQAAVTLTARREAEDFYPLIGFTLVAVEDVPEDGLYDRDGNRIM